MATAVLMIGVRPRKVVLCCKKMVRWGLGCRDKRGLQGLQAATCRRMKRGCGGRERGRCVGPGRTKILRVCVSLATALRLCNASGRTRLSLSGRQNPKKEKRAEKTAVCAAAPGLGDRRITARMGDSKSCASLTLGAEPESKEEWEFPGRRRGENAARCSLPWPGRFSVSKTKRRQAGVTV